jgi:hypothetical protein
VKFPGPTRPPRRFAAVRRFGRDRSEADPLTVGMGVIPFTAPGVVLSVVGGLYERVAIRHVDCVGGMAAG